MLYKNEILFRRYFCKFFWLLRILIKKVLLKLNLRNVSFCKSCGIDVRDFSVSDEEWRKNVPNNMNVLCWNCYCDFKFLNKGDNK